jgi:hypothetical protein
MKKFSYYSSQLERIDFTKNDYAPTFKINHTHGSTNNMDLNKESAADLKQWLEANFGV